MKQSGAVVEGLTFTTQPYHIVFLYAVRFGRTQISTSRVNCGAWAWVQLDIATQY